MIKAEEIIIDLDLLNTKEKLSIEEIEELEIKLKYEGIKHYLESLKHGTKPETASAELLRAFFPLQVFEAVVSGCKKSLQPSPSILLQ